MEFKIKNTEEQVLDYIATNADWNEETQLILTINEEKKRETGQIELSKILQAEVQNVIDSLIANSSLTIKEEKEESKIYSIDGFINNNTETSTITIKNQEMIEKLNLLLEKIKSSVETEDVEYLNNLLEI